MGEGIYKFQSCTATGVDECALNPCQNGGTCEDGDNKYTCKCKSGWEGVNCETGKKQENICYSISLFINVK